MDGIVYYGEISEGQKAKFYDLKEKKETTMGEFNFSISSNHKKIIAKQGNKWFVTDLPTPSKPAKLDKEIDLSRMKAWVDYSQEWKQIYDESWRQMRDFFYVENMHGLNWKAMHDKYAVLVPYVRHRDDLTYIIGELIGD